MSTRRTESPRLRHGLEKGALLDNPAECSLGRGVRLDDVPVAVNQQNGCLVGIEEISIECLGPQMGFLG